MEFHFNKHISGQFNEELENVKHNVLVMGGIVEQQLCNALDSILKNDSELANRVFIDDAAINDYEISIDEECTRIIAKRQPAASDLRLVMAIIKIIADLERIGDESGRIAKAALDNYAYEHKDVLHCVDQLGRHVLKSLRNVLDAFARMDVEAAFAVHKEDLKIDQEYKRALELLTQQMMSEPDLIPAIMDVTWSVRALERIGDRCKNISEYIIYFVKGKDVRHLSREDIEKNLFRG